jgi:hypothetical protein
MEEIRVTTKATLKLELCPVLRTQVPGTKTTYYSTSLALSLEEAWLLEISSTGLP